MPVTMAGVMNGNSRSSLSAAALGSTNLPICAPAGAASTATNARTARRARARRDIAVMSITPCARSEQALNARPVAGVRVGVGKTEQAELQHHPGRQHRRCLGPHDFLHQFPGGHVGIEIELEFSRTIKVR